MSHCPPRGSSQQESLVRSEVHEHASMRMCVPPSHVSLGGYGNASVSPHTLASSPSHHFVPARSSEGQAMGEALLVFLLQLTPTQA